MSKLSLGCWVTGAVMLLTVVTIQIVKPATSQIGWDNVNALMANTLQLHSTVEDGNTRKAAPHEMEGTPIGVEQQTPNNSTSSSDDENQQDEQQDTQQETQPTATINQATQGNIININSATVEQLDTLPGIGPSKAKAIIDYRTKYGNFRSLEQLMEVKGIGPKIFAKMKTDITI